MFTLDEYQKQAKSTATYNDGVRGFSFEELQQLTSLSYCLHGLAGEAGEANEKHKKFLRGGPIGSFEEYKALLAKELGDTLWYVSQAAVEIGMSLDDIARMNLEKLADRKKRGVLHGSGDDR